MKQLAFSESPAEGVRRLHDEIERAWPLDFALDFRRLVQLIAGPHHDEVSSMIFSGWNSSAICRA
jgi:hypothetical protein